MVGGGTIGDGGGIGMGGKASASSVLWIRNGTLVTSAGRRAADIECAAGRIRSIVPRGGDAAVDPPPQADASVETIDAAGCYVFPGFMDPHVHAWLPLGGGLSARSNYANTSRAALSGGTTCFMDFAGSGLEPTLTAAREEWRRRAEGESSCDYLWHLTVTRWSDAIRDELETFVAAGLRSIKIYLAYRPALAISDADLFSVLSFAAAHDVVVMAHCENADLIPALQQRLLEEGKTGPEWHEPSRPPMVEAEGVTRFLTFAAATGAKAYVVHVSSAESLAAAERFRGRTSALHLETMPHYLLLDSSYTARPDFEGAKWVLSPPLRTPADQTALWAALAEGRIDTLATDHCPFDFRGQKERGRGDFTRIPNGIAGIEERMPLMLTEALRASPRLSLERLVAVAAENPAKIFGLYPRKGSLQPGADADVAIWDPNAGEHVLTQAAQSLDTDYNPYEGFRVRGRFRAVVARGEIKIRDGRWMGREGGGKLL